MKGYNDMNVNNNDGVDKGQQSVGQTEWEQTTGEHFRSSSYKANAGQPYNYSSNGQTNERQPYSSSDVRFWQNASLATNLLIGVAGAAMSSDSSLSILKYLAFVITQSLVVSALMGSDGRSRGSKPRDESWEMDEEFGMDEGMDAEVDGEEENIDEWRIAEVDEGRDEEVEEVVEGEHEEDVSEKAAVANDTLNSLLGGFSEFLEQKAKEYGSMALALAALSSLPVSGAANLSVNVFENLVTLLQNQFGLSRSNAIAAANTYNNTLSVDTIAMLSKLVFIDGKDVSSYGPSASRQRIIYSDGRTEILSEDLIPIFLYPANGVNSSSILITSDTTQPTGTVAISGSSSGSLSLGFNISASKAGRYPFFILGKPSNISVFGFDTVAAKNAEISIKPFVQNSIIYLQVFGANSVIRIGEPTERIGFVLIDNTTAVVGLNGSNFVCGGTINAAERVFVECRTPTVMSQALSRFFSTNLVIPPSNFVVPFVPGTPPVDEKALSNIVEIMGCNSTEILAQANSTVLAQARMRYEELSPSAIATLSNAIVNPIGLYADSDNDNQNTLRVTLSDGLTRITFNESSPPPLILFTKQTNVTVGAGTTNGPVGRAHFFFNDPESIDSIDFKHSTAKFDSGGVVKFTVYNAVGKDLKIRNDGSLHTIIVGGSVEVFVSGRRRKVNIVKAYCQGNSSCPTIHMSPSIGEVWTDKQENLNGDIPPDVPVYASENLSRSLSNATFVGQLFRNLTRPFPDLPTVPAGTPLQNQTLPPPQLPSSTPLPSVAVPAVSSGVLAPSSSSVVAVLPSTSAAIPSPSSALALPTSSQSIQASTPALTHSPSQNTSQPLVNTSSSSSVAASLGITSSSSAAAHLVSSSSAALPPPSSALALPTSSQSVQGSSALPPPSSSSQVAVISASSSSTHSSRSTSALALASSTPAIPTECFYNGKKVQIHSVSESSCLVVPVQPLAGPSGTDALGNEVIVYAQEILLDPSKLKCKYGELEISYAQAPNISPEAKSIIESCFARVLNSPEGAIAVMGIMGGFSAIVQVAILKWVLRMQATTLGGSKVGRILGCTALPMVASFANSALTIALDEFVNKPGSASNIAPWYMAAATSAALGALSTFSYYYRNKINASPRASFIIETICCIAGVLSTYSLSAVQRVGNVTVAQFLTRNRAGAIIVPAVLVAIPLLFIIARLCFKRSDFLDNLLNTPAASQQSSAANSLQSVVVTATPGVQSQTGLHGLPSPPDSRTSIDISMGSMGSSVGSSAGSIVSRQNDSGPQSQPNPPALVAPSQNLGHHSSNHHQASQASQSSQPHHQQSRSVYNPQNPPNSNALAASRSPLPLDVSSSVHPSLAYQSRKTSRKAHHRAGATGAAGATTGARVETGAGVVRRDVGRVAVEMAAMSAARPTGAVRPSAGTGHTPLLGSPTFASPLASPFTSPYPSDQDSDASSPSKLNQDPGFSGLVSRADTTSELEDVAVGHIALNTSGPANPVINPTVNPFTSSVSNHPVINPPVANHPVINPAVYGDPVRVQILSPQDLANLQEAVATSIAPRQDAAPTASHTTVSATLRQNAAATSITRKNREQSPPLRP